MNDFANDRTSTSTPFLSNRTYDALKWVAQILLPAMGALYFGLGEIWGLPKTGEVVGTITVVDTFLGVLLGLSASQYSKSDARFDGHIHVEEGARGPVASMEVHGDPGEMLQNKDELLFKVKKDDGELAV